MARSLSARRAWIEIISNAHGILTYKVALRKESVDRNAGGFPTIKAMRGSLSARRAWIEIHDGSRRLTRLIPSLSARRAWIEIIRGP